MIMIFFCLPIKGSFPFSPRTSQLLMPIILKKLLDFHLYITASKLPNSIFAMLQLNCSDLCIQSQTEMYSLGVTEERNSWGT